MEAKDYYALAFILGYFPAAYIVGYAAVSVLRGHRAQNEARVSAWLVGIMLMLPLSLLSMAGFVWWEEGFQTPDWSAGTWVMASLLLAYCFWNLAFAYSLFRWRVFVADTGLVLVRAGHPTRQLPWADIRAIEVSSVGSRFLYLMSGERQDLPVDDRSFALLERAMLDRDKRVITRKQGEPHGYF